MNRQERELERTDPSWHLRALRVLARDYPEISDEVWKTAVMENARERVAERQQAEQLQDQEG